MINPTYEANITTVKAETYLTDILIVLSFAFAFTAFPIGGLFFGLLSLRRVNRDDFFSSSILTIALIVSAVRSFIEVLLAISGLVWIAAFLLSS
jgi:hypothetical protein